MIKYALACDKGHEFESWFSDSAGYDVQARWIQNDHEVTETRHVEVTPGSRVEMDFPAQPRTPEE